MPNPSTYIAKYTEYSNQKIHLDTSPDTYTRSYMSSKTHRNRLAPYISGYWYLALIPPIELIDDDNLVKTYVKAFNASAEGFGPPSRNITKQEVIGFGGIKKYLITSQEFSNSFSITFREHANLELFNILTHWTGMIHPFTGKHNKIYKGQCVVILAKPTFSKLNGDGTPMNMLDKPDIEEIFFFDGVFPESQPIDKFDSNIESNETKTLDVTFNFDGAFMTKVNYTDQVNGVSFLEVFNTYIEAAEFHESYLESPITVTVDNDQIGL